MNGNTNKISNVLQQVRLLKNKNIELAAVTGEDFNIFSILRVESDEVRTHTAFLTDLLNPQGSHRQGAAFLNLFLALDALKNSKADEYKNPETFQVSEEAFTDQGRIDILLEKNDACIVIENKIYAADQNAQLERYHQYALNKGYSDGQVKLVYLTLDGSSPSKKSRGDLSEDRVKCLSYSMDIINWLEECMKLKEVQRVSPVREIVFQYRDLLKQLTGQSTNRRESMELTKLLIKDQNYELIPDLENMILEFKVHLQFKFWEELKKQICELPEVDWHETQDAYHVPSEDNIHKFYRWLTERYLCQRFHLGAVWKRYEIALSTSIDYRRDAKLYNIHFGFILFEDGNLVNNCLDESFNELAAPLLDEGFNRVNKYWLVRKRSERIGFPAKYPNSVVDDLLNNGKREEIVKKLVSGIREAINNLKKNLN